MTHETDRPGRLTDRSNVTERHPRLAIRIQSFDIPPSGQTVRSGLLYPNLETTVIAECHQNGIAGLIDPLIDVNTEPHPGCKHSGLLVETLLCFERGIRGSDEEEEKNAPPDRHRDDH